MFAVSADGVAFTSNRHTFTYYPVPTAIDVYPTVVSELGGSSIHVYGANFYNTESLACSFDGERDVAPARWISSTQVACVAPSHPFWTGFLGSTNTSEENKNNFPPLMLSKTNLALSLMSSSSVPNFCTICARRSQSRACLSNTFKRESLQLVMDTEQVKARK